MNLTQNFENMIGKFGYTVVIQRTNVGKYINGIYEESIPHQFSIQGIVQPLNFKELMMIPEGNRTKKRIKVFSREALRTQSEKYPADIILWEGKKYQVMTVQSYLQPGSAFSIGYHRIDAEELHE